MLKNRKHAVCSMAAAYIGAFAVNAAQSVTSGLTASQLVDLIVPSGGDITIIGTPIYTGASIASGSFSGFDADSGLPFSSGLLMTSGHVNNALGPNTSGSSSQDNLLGGSALLEAVTGQAFSLDASTLTFQFKSATPNFSFRYVFASEEYNEFVNEGFSDAFAFVLDNGSTQVNLATVGSGQVSIDTVNLGVNSSYYSNNSPGPYNIQYDGLAGGIDALSLIAGATIVPDQTYTISLIIADRGDRILDSGVFLQGGSFTGDELPPPPTNDVPEPGTYAAAAFVAVVAVGSYRRRTVRRQAL